MTVNFRGYLFNDAGTAVNGATVALLETGTTTQEASTTTDSDGLWYFTESDQDRYDVKITSGSSVRYIRWDDQISLKEIDVRNNSAAGTPAATFTNLTNSASNQVAVFSGANSTRADGDEIYLSFKMADSAGNIDEFARMTVDATDVTTTQEDGQIRFSVLVDGTLTDVFTINSTESAGTTMTLDVSGDLTLDADGGDIFFKDGGTTFGSATNNSGNLILKSGTTTAATFSGANVTFAGTVDATTDFTLGDTVITDGVITDSTGLQLAANLDIDGTADISGDLTLSGGADGALQFTNAGENSIKIPDNQASALIIEEANNAYITFVTTNSSEAITVAKATTFSAGIADSGTIAAGTWNGTAIASGYIAADAITGAKIADDAIDSEHYTDGSIDTAHLAADAVTGAKIADDAIDSEHYTDGSIDTAHIADNQVTLAKMAGLTRGSIIYGDASGDPAALAVGSANYVLTSDGTDAAWAAVSAAAVTAVANGSDNRISTFSSSTALNGEANLTFNGSALQVTGTLTVGEDDTGHDVKFFGASAGAYLEWDESADQLRIMGASADATTSTGKLLLATSLTDINANDVIGKIEFQAPHEAGTGDSQLVAASIAAVAQATFSSSVNSTDLIFYTGDSEAATEKFRITSQGELGVGGANYGTDGQVLTSTGAGTAPAWEDAAGGGGTIDLVADGSVAAGAAVALTSAGKVIAITGHGSQYLAGFPVATTDYTSYDDDATEGSLVYCGSTGKVAAVGYWGDLSNYPYVTIGTYSTTTKAFTWGTPVIINSASANFGLDAVWDENVDRLVIGYRDGGDSNKGKTLVYQISATGNTVVTADGGGEYGPGTAQEFEAGATLLIGMVFDNSANKVLVFYKDDDDSDYGKATIGTVTGGSTNTMANTTPENFNGNNALRSHAIAWDTENAKGLCSFQDNADSMYSKCVAFTHDSSNFTFGTVIEPWGANQLVNVGYAYYAGRSVSFDSSNDNFVLVGDWQDGDSDWVLRAVAVSVSGTTCTAGTPVNIATDHVLGNGTLGYTNDSRGDWKAILYDPDRDVHVLVANSTTQGSPDPESGDDGRGGQGDFDHLYYLTLGGTGDRVITASSRAPLTGAVWQSETPWSRHGNGFARLAYDTTNNVMHYWTHTEAWSAIHAASSDYDWGRDIVSTFHGSTAALAYTKSNMTAFIGFNTSAKTDGQTATVTVKGGLNENQSSLTAGQHYYISDDGVLTTTKPFGSQYLWYAGVATAATKLLVTNDRIFS